MGRKLHPRLKKNFFDPALAILGGGQSNKYVDAFHREAAAKIALRRLTERIRVPVNIANVRPIADDACIYGIMNTDICKEVTLESLRSRVSIAQTIKPWTVKRAEGLDFKLMMKARKFTEMHEPILKCTQGPFVEH